MKTFLTSRKFILSFCSLAFFALLGFVEVETSEREIKNIIINIKDEYGNHFIDEGDIMRLLSAGYTDSIRGKLCDEIDLKELENRVKSNRFVKSVQVYKDFKGNVLVDIIQHKALARVIQPSGPQSYISEEGMLLPLSEKYTARVLIIQGEGAHKLADSTYMISEEGKEMLKMLHQIDGDAFLKAQVSEIIRKKNGDLQILPQVGAEVIEFGKPKDYEQKFNKLVLYYKNITKQKGYNIYKSVNLKYQDQIICE